MIELEFKINKKILSKAYLKDIDKRDEIGLQYCGFLIPVKFVIDHKDIFSEDDEDCWHDVPLIDWTTSFLVG